MVKYIGTLIILALLFFDNAIAEEKLPRALQGLNPPPAELSKEEAENVRGYMIKDSDGCYRKCDPEKFRQVLAEQAQARETFLEQLGKILIRPGQPRPGGKQ